MAFIAGDASLDDIFLTDYWLVDQYVGGTLWAWGRNSYGQLGDNSTTDRSSPVQTVTGGTNWKQAACGSYHAAGIKTDGTLWCWGRNSYGQLGDNSTTHRSSPVQTVIGGTNWQQVDCSHFLAFSFTAAVKSDGTLWCWGTNSAGELGDNSTTGRSSPVQTVTGGTNWKQVSCGYRFAAAIKTDGTLWCWGSNSYGQLGDNSTTDRSSPVQTVTGGTNWKQVSCGFTHVAAIKKDRSLWCWGSNSYMGSTGGQLGDNSINNTSSPVQTITGGYNWKQVSCGARHTAAIKTDGTLWCWGMNRVVEENSFLGAGQLGDNTTTDRSSPVQTIAAEVSWKQVACGIHTVAVKNG